MSHKYKTKDYTLIYDLIVERNKKYAVITGMKNPTYNFLQNGNLVIPSKVNGIDVLAIGEKAFIYNRNIKNLFFEEGIKYIDKQAFAECLSLNSAVFPKSLKTLEFGCFYSSSLKDITFSEGLEHIGKRAFYNTKLENVHLPDSLIIIGPNAFENTNITNLHLGKKVKEIGDSAFCLCENLTDINLPESLIVVGKHAFKHCNQLKSIILPDSLITLKANVFDYCSSLELIHIGKSLNIFNETYDFAYGCSNLKKITVSPLNHRFIVNNDTLYDKSHKTLIKVFNNTKCDTYIIPDWVDTIADFAFSGVSFNELIIKAPKLCNLDGDSIFAEKIYCVPNSSVEKYFLSEKMNVFPLPPTIEDFLNEISKNNKDINEVK